MKQTAEERQQIEAFLQKVIQKEIPVIEAAQTILRNRHKYASNELASYKAELREKIDKILESDKQGMVDFKHNFSTYRYYEGRVCRLEDIKKSLLEDNPT